MQNYICFASSSHNYCVFPSRGACFTVQKLRDLLKKLKGHDAKSLLKAVSKELVDPSVLKHKSKEVKVNAGCCLAHVLALHSPNAGDIYNSRHIEVCNLV